MRAREKKVTHWRCVHMSLRTIRFSIFMPRISMAPSFSWRIFIMRLRASLSFSLSILTPGFQNVGWGI